MLRLGNGMSGGVTRLWPESDCSIFRFGLLLSLENLKMRSPPHAFRRPTGSKMPTGFDSDHPRSFACKLGRKILPFYLWS